MWSVYLIAESKTTVLLSRSRTPSLKKPVMGCVPHGSSLPPSTLTGCSIGNGLLSSRSSDGAP